jgi:diguanylate cyclase (GGDEF)-like protein
MAAADPLTGLPGRVSLRRVLERTLARRGPGWIGLCFCDLDRFKEVNDGGGHADGDLVLAEVGRRLRALGGGATAARIGGDEFAVLLVGAADEADVMARAHAVGRVLAAPHRLGARSITCPASIGVAVVDPASVIVAAGDDGAVPPEAADDLLRAADLAMYRAKADGFGQVRRYEPAMLESVRRRAAAAEHVEWALDGMHLELCFQPVVRLADRVIVAAEALVRLAPVDGDVEPVDPVELIRIADTVGRLDEVTRWVLDTALAEAVRWPTGPAGPVSVAVNLSPQQLAQPGLVRLVADRVAAAALPPRQLSVEITESGGTVSRPEVVAAVRGLRGLGVGVDLDDVGTRFSALVDLRRLDVDGLKLDRGFVADLAHDRAAAAVVRGLIGIAAALGLRATAEGVEDESCAEILRSLGCDRAQGFLFSPPVAAGTLRNMLASATA